MADDREDLVWEEIKTEHIVQDEWIDFENHNFVFPMEVSSDHIIPTAGEIMWLLWHRTEKGTSFV